MWIQKKYSITTYLKSITTKPYSQIVMRSTWRSRLCETTKNNFQLFMRNCKYWKTKSTNTLKNITMNHCKIILMLLRQCNFYDKIVNFQICDKGSRHILRNVLIVNKISMSLMLSTRKFNTWNHRNHLETKCSWTSSSNYRNQKIQRMKKRMMQYLWWLIVWSSIVT